MDEIDIDDERHRREEAERRARRHRTSEEREQRGEGGKRGSGGGVGDDQAPSSTRHVSKRREHAAFILRAQHAVRILGAQQGQGQQKKGGRSPPPPPTRGKSPSSSSSAPKSPSTPSSTGGGGGGSSEKRGGRSMLSCGRHELNAMRQRLAAAISRESSDTKLVDLANERLKSSREEVKAAEAQLKEAEERWNVVDVDEEGISTTAPSPKRTKVSTRRDVSGTPTNGANACVRQIVAPLAAAAATSASRPPAAQPHKDTTQPSRTSKDQNAPKNGSRRREYPRGDDEC
jgi:hypothetical protein